MFSSSSSPSSDSTLLSPSSSSSSSHPSSSHLKTNNNNQNSATQTTPTTQTQKTMEEVWKDITINSLQTTPISHIHNPTATSTTSHYKGFILQDYLNSGSGPTNPRNSSVDSPQPRTTTTEFQFLDNEFQLQGNHSVPSMISGVAAFDALASSSVLASFAAVDGGFGGGGLDKKVSENGEEGSVDRIRRHKRMIKNRESAARSRARKQAYITELELEVDNFKKENAALKKQQRLLIEVPPAQLPKKHGLRRTSTAPF